MTHKILALAASLLILVGCATTGRFDTANFDAPDAPKAPSVESLILAYTAYHGQGLTQEIPSKQHAELFPKLAKVAFQHQIVLFVAPGLMDLAGDELWGLYSPESEKHPAVIFVNADSTADEQVSTLAHELAHALGPRLPHPQDDVFAQAVSYLFCLRYGFNTAEVTVAYYDGLTPDTTLILSTLANFHSQIEATAEQIFKETK